MPTMRRPPVVDEQVWRAAIYGHPEQVGSHLNVDGLGDWLQRGGAGGAVLAMTGVWGSRTSVLGHRAVTQDEAEDWAADRHDLAERGEVFFSCSQFCCTASKTT